jgi:hypothetical protein
VCWTYWRHRRKTVSLQLFAFRLATIAVLTAAFGAVGITRAVITLARASQHKSAAVLSLWRQYAWAFPSDALGLVPRTPRDVPGVGWEVLALTVGSVLIVRGLVSARSSQKPRNRVLATAGLTLIVELIAVALSGSTPYVSLKLMAYSSPLLTLLVVGSDSWMSQTAGLHGQVARLKALGRASVNVVAPLLFLATTGFALSAGLGKTRPATEVLPVARAAAALPRGKVIQLRVGDAWDQVWLAYFLRDRPIAISAPSVAFIGYSARDAARARTFNASAPFVIRERSPGSYVWRDGKFGIYAVRNSSSG